MLKIISNSPVETKKIAKEFAQELVKSKSEKAAVVAFKGDLGAGKTTFIKNFLKELGVKQKITSPTFTIIKKYKLIGLKNYKFAYHLDCYRIKSASEIKSLGFEKMIDDKNSIVLIEWPSNISKYLPKGRIKIEILHGKSERQRYFIFK